MELGGNIWFWARCLPPLALVTARLLQHQLHCIDCKDEHNTTGNGDAPPLACRVRPPSPSPSSHRRAYGSTLRIPFHNAEQAAAGKRALDVDREVNMDLVERVTSLEGEVLVV